MVNLICFQSLMTNYTLDNEQSRTASANGISGPAALPEPGKGQHPNPPARSTWRSTPAPQGTSWLQNSYFCSKEGLGKCDQKVLLLIYS